MHVKTHVLHQPYKQQMPTAQACLTTSIANPVPERYAASAGIWPSDVIGVILWAAGFVMESAADFQKYGFKQKPANKGRFVNVGEPGTSCMTVGRKMIREVMPAVSIMLASAPP